MKTIRRAIRIMVCGLGAMTSLSAVAAEKQAGFYIGLAGGQSTYDIEKSELDGVVRSVLLSEGMFPISASSTFEDSDTSLSLLAGYQFNPWIAVEGSFIDLGTAEYRYGATVNPPGPIVSAPVAVDVDVESTGFTAAGLGSLPLGDVFDLHARLGFIVATTELTVRTRIASSAATQSDDLDSVGAFFGFGVGFNIGTHLSLSLDWTRYDNVGDENEDEDISTEAGFDVDALSLSAMFRF